MFSLGAKKTTSEIDFSAEPGQRIIGFWGAQSNVAITQIGFLVANDDCIEKYGVEKQVDDNVVDEDTDEQLITDPDGSADAKTVSFSSKPGGEDNIDEEGSDEVVLIVVIIVVVVIVIAVLIILITHCLTRKRSNNRVTVLNEGSHHFSANNSAVPQESEENGGRPENKQDTDRKESERNLADGGTEP